MIGKNNSLVHSELSYTLVGKSFEVYNQLGSGHKEKIYQQAFAEALSKAGLKFGEQIYCPIYFGNKIVGKYYLDFLVNDLVVVELKVGRRYRKQDYEQIKRYLSHSKIGLGLLVRFDESGVTFQRVLRPHS